MTKKQNQKRIQCSLTNTALSRKVGRSKLQQGAKNYCVERKIWIQKKGTLVSHFNHMTNFVIKLSEVMKWVILGGYLFNFLTAPSMESERTFRESQWGCVKTEQYIFRLFNLKWNRYYEYMCICWKVDTTKV